MKSEKKQESRNRYFKSVNNLDWNQLFYLNLEEEVHPFNDLSRFRPLNRAYDGNDTFWSTPSPEPDLSKGFWQEVKASFTKGLKADSKTESADIFVDDTKSIALNEAGPSLRGDHEIHRAAQHLAASILRWQPDPEKIIFVSILRAGVPITEWLCKMLPGSVGAALSLFVGIGIDQAALLAIQRDFPDRSLVFVDGWTGRGGVARELAKLERGPLAVLIDPWGWADFAGIREDIFCPSACFTGLATLGFSRTFVVDNDNFFSAYRFSDKFANPELVRSWKSSSPGYPLAQSYVDNSEVEKFHADTELRIHSNEVCRALINAAPKTMFFADSAICVKEHFPLLLELAEHRGVESKFNVRELKSLKTRVACSL